MPTLVDAVVAKACTKHRLAGAISTAQLRIKHADLTITADVLHTDNTHTRAVIHVRMVEGSCGCGRYPQIPADFDREKALVFDEGRKETLGLLLVDAYLVC